MLQHYEYSAYGENLSGKDAVNTFRYLGRYGVQADDDTGLEYDWNRWRDPRIGAWVSEDPLRSLSQDINFYRYSFDNPTKFSDTDGLDVTVFYRDGALYFGHIGIGVDGYPSQGFYPARNLTREEAMNGEDVPGEVKLDVQSIKGQFTIHTTECQDQKILAAIRETRWNPGMYNLFSRNCAIMVEYWLAQGGLSGVVGQTPEDAFNSARERFGGQ